MEEVIKSKKPFSPRASYTVAFKAQVIDDYSSDWWYEHQINRPFVQLDTPDILLSNTGDIDQDNELDLEFDMDYLLDNYISNLYTKFKEYDKTKRQDIFKQLIIVKSNQPVNIFSLYSLYIMDAIDEEFKKEVYFHKTSVSTSHPEIYPSCKKLKGQNVDNMTLWATKMITI